MYACVYATLGLILRTLDSMWHSVMCKHCVCTWADLGTVLMAP